MILFIYVCNTLNIVDESQSLSNCGQQNCTFAYECPIFSDFYTSVCYLFSITYYFIYFIYILL